MAAMFAACAAKEPEKPVTTLGTEPIGTGSTTTTPAATTPEKPKEENKGPWGYLQSQFADTHATACRKAASKVADPKLWTIDFAEANKDQVQMNDKLDLMLTKGYKVVITGMVSASAGDVMIEKTEKAGADRYIIFYKNEPNPIDKFNASKQAYFCGSIYQQAGEAEGQAIEKYMKANPDKWDKNKDGVLQYIQLVGTLGSMEATYRTTYSIKYLTDKGVKVEKLFEDTAEYNRAKAMEKMQTWLTALGTKQVEAVFANNDDMALGAIEALKAIGYFAPDGKLYVPVVGIDATAVGRDAIRDGTMLATSYNNPIALGETTVYLAHALANGLELTKDNLGGYEMTNRNREPAKDGKYMWIDYIYVDKDNLVEFEKGYING
jgi:methyl-galactoside transport system substrate-binding protein